MRVIGMISGTSFDAIEAVAVELELDRETLVVDFHRHLSVPYPPELRSAVAELLPPATTSIEAVCRLDTLIGAQFAEVAERLSLEAFAGQVDVVCSHGQTVFHWVEAGRARGTLQLGQPAFIAERTGATVVSDLRARDIAKGGHGAPLASLLDEALKVAETIASMSLPSVLAAKEAVDSAFETSLAEGVRFERRVFHSLFATADQKEGMAAFVAKRPAKFENK